MSDHVVSMKVYFTIFFLLMFFTFLTVYLAFIDFGPFSNVIAMAIACTKATLVVLYFMHIRYSGKLFWIVIIASLFWIGILFLLTLGDYFTRGWGTYPLRNPIY